MNNLLTDPMIRVRAAGGEGRSLSLPAVLAALSSSNIEAFAALMPHQRQGWFSFLVQLAAIALNHAGIQAPPSESSEWAGMLRALTPTFPGDEPWTLVVGDLQRPAFFQPPVPEGSLRNFRGPFESPSDIDILVTSKNHDVKMARLQHPQRDHWIYALVTLQTMQGFLGQGNYGISRMNGGFASRPSVGLVPGDEWGARFRRDLGVSLNARDRIVDAYEEHYQSVGGLALLWVEAWDGTTAIPFGNLDPYYVEICRRVRLGIFDGGLSVYSAPTKSSRIEAKDIKGNTGDPWVPIKSKEAIALTVPGGGFTYNLLQRVLFSSDYQPGACLRPHDEDPSEGVSVLASVLARGQGKTEGIYERRLPLPARVRSYLQLEEGRDRLASMAKQRVDDAALLESKALRPALLALVQGAPEQLKFKDERPRKYADAFDERVDDVFFPSLWESLDQDEDDARARWQRDLVKIGREILNEAEMALPIPLARWYRAVTVAERIYSGSVWRNFPQLRKQEEVK